MRKLFLITVSICILFSCKKKPAEIQHSVKFSSNITDSRYYSLAINNSTNNDISTTYMLGAGSDVKLILLSAGGDTASVNSGDSLWVRGGIVVDGKSVKSYAGYDDVTLSYHIQ